MILIKSIIIVFINLILYKYNYKIASILNIFDKPNNFLKKHSYSIPLTGGFFFLINFLVIVLMSNLNIYFETNYKLYIFLVLCFFIFLVGFFDDKYDIYYIFRIAIFLIIILTLLYFDSDFLISKIIFESLNINYELSYFASIIFTLFSITIFVFSFNMLDGINLQSILYFFSLILFFIVKNVNISFFVFLIIPILFFLYFNNKNKIFLGDSGSYLISFFLSCLIIKNYNFNNFKIEEIFLLMILPGVDLIRVFFNRILIRKNPFAGDLNHIHHLVCSKYSILKSNIMIQFLHLSAITSFFLFNNFLISLLIFFSLYCLLIFVVSVKK